MLPLGRLQRGLLVRLVIERGIAWGPFEPAERDEEAAMQRLVRRGFALHVHTGAHSGTMRYEATPEGARAILKVALIACGGKA